MPESNDNAVSQVARIEQGVTVALNDSTSLNPLVDLILLLSSTSDPLVAHKAIYALYRIFVLVISSGRLKAGKGQADEVKAVRSWLSERLEEYIDLLCGFLKDDQEPLRSAALQVLMSLVKHLSYVSKTGTRHLHELCLRKWVRALLICPASKRAASSSDFGQGEGKVETDVRDSVGRHWLGAYDDLRLSFLRESTLLFRSDQSTALHPHVPQNLLLFLELISTMPPVSRDGAKWMDEKAPPPIEHNSFRTQISSCWLSLLPVLSTSSSLSARALAVLHRGVMPYMNQPLRLMDWVAGCVDHGGSIGLLALNALYQLVTEYNLDYPDLYLRLYAFLDRDVLHLKHRARFFRLAELFLSSTHLPATLLASFVKRLSRLSLSAPPAAIVMLLPFVYNILKRHPALMVMVHNPASDFENDTFDPDEKSPLLTNAIESSLWELASHQEHYLPSVATMARIFRDAFTKPSYAMEDFLDHTYTTLFDAETRRKIRKEPALVFEFRSPGKSEDEVDTFWQF